VTYGYRSNLISLNRWTQRLGLLLALAFLSVGCSRSPSATPSPPTATVGVAAATTAAADATPADTLVSPGALTDTVPATVPDTVPAKATALPSPTMGIATQGAVFTSPRFSYTVTLPCCWLALPTPNTAMESALAGVEGEDGVPIWGDLSERLRERETGAVMELIALLPAEESATTPVAQVTVSVLPANGLTLDDYLTATEAELNSIASTKVLTALIEPTLGAGGLPAVLIEYTATPATASQASDATSDQAIAGLQVAFFGPSSEHIIVLTFTATTTQYAALQSEFMEIIRTITLVEPAT
jgi:hypothetical protein